uniref:Alpha-MPP n=1 Tax=Schistosoma japonicum TaxID=6182 RepID=C1LKQ4_SCHJA|nr:mitochondrial processing peptidase [Schistosoma japonicum]CAX75283.1 mitochondrial processing peptidase [Schistosoma japonicum]
MRPGFCMRHCFRRLSSSFLKNQPDITKVSLKDVAFQGLNSHTKSFTEDRETKITKLDNGLRVASQNKLGSQCAIGVIIKAGPRYEGNFVNGTSHYLEKLGFHSSDIFVDRNAVQEAMENCNSIFDCQVARDFIIYAVSGFNTNMDRLTHVLSETVLRAKITEEEIEMAAKSISFELEALERSPPVEPIMNELLHIAAYKNNTLGLPKYCPKQNLNKINRENIVRFIATNYIPERMVIAGVGIEHDLLVKSVEKYFIPTVPNVSNEKIADGLSSPDCTISQYTGGYHKLERDLSQYHAPMPEFAHAAIGFESCSYTDPQFVPACVLHSLLGGGGSFSAGGPGKGMYTRLYVNILNEHHWVNSAQAENHAYTDTGLFTIIGSSFPPYLDRLVYTLIDELRYTASSSISHEELSRAKHQLKSMLLMNLETRAVSFEDIARQVLTADVRREPEYWVDRIDKVTEADLHALLHRMIYKSKPTLVGYGRVEQLPTLDDITPMLSESCHKVKPTMKSKMPKFFKGFI